MGEVVQFRDPDQVLTGAERDVALKLYAAALPAIASAAIGAAFSAAHHTPGCGRLGCETVLPAFVAAMRRELDGPGY